MYMKRRYNKIYNIITKQHTKARMKAIIEKTH